MSEQVKSIIERILRLKEEQDSLSEDIKEIYAEAKSNGFDKTALGQAVATIRKKQKDPQKFEETGTVVDLYLGAYYGAGTPVATHAHETMTAKGVKAPAIASRNDDDLEIPSYLRREPVGAA